MPNITTTRLGFDPIDKKNSDLAIHGADVLFAKTFIGGISHHYTIIAFSVELQVVCDKIPLVIRDILLN